MLVLTRRVGEQVRINDNLVITVLSNDRGHIKLGFDGPREVRVDREEIYKLRHGVVNENVQLLRGNATPE